MVGTSTTAKPSFNPSRINSLSGSPINSVSHVPILWEMELAGVGWGFSVFLG